MSPHALAARIERDLNAKRCRAGSTWGYTSSYIWTSSGCRGDFLVSYGSVVPGTVNGNVAAGAKQTIRCGHLHGARVQCSADFEVTYGPGNSGTCSQNGTDPNRTIRSGTLGTRVISCGAGYGNRKADGNGNDNGNGRNNGRGNMWGWNGRETWTKNGCRGDFEVTCAAGRDR